MLEMKKVFAIILLCALLIVHVSISYGEDNMAGLWFTVIDMPVISTADGYYMNIDGFMYYYDPDTFSPLLLCSRLNCMHRKEENLADCDAWIGFGSITAYGEHLYYTNGPDVCRMNPDGTAHEKWMTFITSDKSQWISYGFQGKYYFFIPMILEPGDELMINTQCKLCVLDLSRPSDMPITVEEWTGFGEMGIALLEVLDGKLYYLTGAYEGEKKLWAFDLETQQKTEMLSFQVPAYHYVADSDIFVLQQNTGVFRLRNGSAERETIILKDSNDLRLTDYYWDNRYIYGVTVSENQMSCEVEIWDMEGHPVVRNNIPGNKLFMIAGEHLLFTTDRSDEPGLAVGLDSLLQGKPVIHDFIYPERISYEPDQH